MWAVDLWVGGGWRAVEEGISFRLAHRLAREYERDGQTARWRWLG